MKNKLYVTYLYPPGNNINHLYCQQFCYLEKIIEEREIQEVLFISFNKTNSDLKKILKLSKFKYPNIISHYTIPNIKNPPSYGFIIREITREIEAKEGDLFYIFGGIMLPNNSVYYYYNNYYNSLSSFSFNSFKIRIIKLLLVQELINLGLEVHHFVFDPQELIFKKTIRYHGYSDKNLNLQRVDSFQYYLLNKEEREKTLKTELFTFGATILTKDRDDLHNIMAELFKIDTPGYNIYYKNREKKINSFIHREEYLKKIKASKYTLISRAYEKNSFSIYRFIESVFNYCVPLLLEDSNYYILEQFGFDIEWLENYLVVSNTSEIIRKVNTLDYKYISASLSNILFSNDPEKYSSLSKD